jgi:hypothetical protein
LFVDRKKIYFEQSKCGFRKLDLQHEKEWVVGLKAQERLKLFEDLPL